MKKIGKFTNIHYYFTITITIPILLKQLFSFPLLEEFFPRLV